jgi:hypothetical protein
MRHFPKKLISFRKLQGGQYGTLDVSAVSPDYVQAALGGDFVQFTRPQWIAMRSMVDRFFGSETERVILTRDDGEPVLFEELDAEAIDVEEVPGRDPGPRVQRMRPRHGRRRPDIAG